MHAQQPPSYVIDVRIRERFDKTRFYGLPWRTPLSKWTRADMEGVAAAVGPLVADPSDARLRFFVRDVEWDRHDGLEFTVAAWNEDAKKEHGKCAYVRLANVPKRVAEKLVDFNTLKSYYVWHEVAPLKKLPDALREAAVGNEHTHLDEILRSNLCLNGARRDLWNGAQDKDEQEISRLVKTAARKARASARNARALRVVATRSL